MPPRASGSLSETVRISSKDVKTHINTGNWHVIDSTNLNSLGFEPMAIHIIDNFLLQVKFEKYSDTGILLGEDQYSRQF